ncbi:DUF5675 family protein [Pedobacter mendelii]|uniref:DUF5675 domain-containing protein n=1 Tax=Pedobacter mendelii TaxID=1908240 RepID=A0ABQ2BKM9_9SPHI|nr:DUF5675 family protein [Pedobacter mendelii]GGI28401.1 hypothetical protein GCM10008119_32460 [Pedobacter mendelii]
MQLFLSRTYFKGGTNGKIFFDGKLVCESIELPWRNNKRNVSCIPEGRYRLIKRHHTKHGLQLALSIVPNREGILIHPANFALRELQGCIAPVTKCIGEGEGNYSRIALERLEDLVYPVLEKGEEVFLLITSVKSSS